MTLGSASLACDLLENCTLKVGLSWPNLQKALGYGSKPNEWAVLYLGSGIKSGERAEFQFVSRKGNPIDAPEAPIRGLVVLDGTWSQAKTLWWRNAWLLKLKRIVLYPKTPSLYGKKRKEPKPECVSSLEALALALGHLGMRGSEVESMRAAFGRFLEEA